MQLLLFNAWITIVLLISFTFGASEADVESSTKAKGWFTLPFELPNLDFLTDIPQHVSNFFESIIPTQLKSFLNYDPKPDWVPPDWIPEEENEENEDDIVFSPSSSSYTKTVNGTNRNDTQIRVPRNLTQPQEIAEKGNLDGIGRNLIRTITRSIDSVTSGLDTNRTFFSGVLNGFKDRIKAIYPGTQWCGDGTVARDSRDLGFFHRADSCCREHDKCFDFIQAGEIKHGLHNDGLFTRSHCKCDSRFYQCLKNVNDVISVQLGTAYFTILGPQCYEEEYPISHCEIKLGLTNRCLQYSLEKSSSKIYQWFDNPEF